MGDITNAVTGPSASIAASSSTASTTTSPPTTAATPAASKLPGSEVVADLLGVNLTLQAQGQRANKEEGLHGRLDKLSCKLVLPSG